MAMTKAAWLEKNGFSADGLTYVVFGDNTYSIKDWLKEQGCKYSRLLGWHAAQPLDVPEGYGMISFSFDDLFEWGENTDTAYPFEHAETKVQAALDATRSPSLSEYMGAIGERLRDLTALYKSSFGFQGAYGYTYRHTFQIGENVLVWFTTKELNLEEDELVLLTGTVKKHDEYRGVKMTNLTRCIIKEVE